MIMDIDGTRERNVGESDGEMEKEEEESVGGPDSHDGVTCVPPPSFLSLPLASIVSSSRGSGGGGKR